MPVAVVLDLGATNAAAVAVDARGQILAQNASPNAPVPQKNGESGWIVWDLDAIWSNLAKAARHVVNKVGRDDVRAVTVTTFGADGAPVRRDGTLTYPVISWQCARTASLADEVARTVGAREIFRSTGYQMFPFNTLLRRTLFCHAGTVRNAKRNTATMPSSMGKFSFVVDARPAASPIIAM